MKNASSRDCFCALCRTPRKLSYARHLSALNYLQIILLTAAFTWASFPLFQFKALSSVFVIWAAFEISKKLLYRKDIKCKVCGFDPTWYRKDVRVARRQVETFLKENPDSPMLRAKKTLSNVEISQ
jgi:hypothetical protein